MTSDTLLEIAFATIKRRWRLLVALCLASYPFTIVALRAIDFPYTAQIRLFALPQASQSPFDGPSTALLLGGGSGSDRNVTLSGQDALVHSTRIFDAVRKIDPDLQRTPAAKETPRKSLGPIIGKLQEIIFGKEYVQTRQRWKDREFGNFKQRISVEVDQDSVSISLKYKHQNPKLALASVKIAADELQAVNMEISKNQAAKKVDFLASKIADARVANDRIGEEITAFIRKNKISNDPRTIEPRYRGLSEASELVNGARLEIVQRETALNEAKKVSTFLQTEIKRGLMNDREGRLKNLTMELRRYEQGMATLPMTGQNATRAAVKRQIGSVRAKISEEFNSNGTKLDVSNLQSLLATNEASILEQEAALRAAQKQLEFGGAQFKKFERQLSDLPELSADLAKLTLVQTQQRKILEHLMQRFLEAQIEADTKLDQFYITEEPTLIDGDKYGKLPLLLALIALITIALVAVLVLIDLQRGVILTKHQLTKFKIPQYIGSIAFEATLRRRKAYAVVNESGIGFRIFHALKKYSGETIDGRKSRVIAVTSKNAKVGKTVTSLGIAAAAQSTGIRTIIIDADYLATDRAMKNQCSEGIMLVRTRDEIFKYNASISNINQKRQRLTVWSIGDEFLTESDVTQFFLHDFAETLNKLKQIYDCIVIDCAPCFLSLMLSIYEKADINLLCFAEGTSTLADVTHVSEVVEPACKEGAKIFSILTLARLKSNSVAPVGSDGIYYKTIRAA